MNKALNIFIIVGLLVILLVVAAMGYDYLTKDRAPENLTTAKKRSPLRISPFTTCRAMPTSCPISRASQWY